MSHRMPTETATDDRVSSLASFFHPRSVAVVGASPRESSGGHKIFENLTRLFDGPLYPIHPSAEEILGYKCYGSVSDVPHPPDLVVVFVPSRSIPGIVEECIDRGVKAVCIESGGFADAGTGGAILQEELARLCAGSNIRLWGPNCAGYVTSDPYLSTAFVDAPPTMQKGSASLIFQSGMAAAALLAEITSRNLLALDMACSIGNKVDVDEADLLEYMAEGGHVRTVALYLESIGDGTRLSRALAEILPRATVAALVGNRTAAGLEAAATHTGAVIRQSDTARALLRHRGVIEASDFTELTEMARALDVLGPRTGGPRLAVLTFSGAAGVVAADLMEDAGMSLAKLSPATVTTLREIFPDWYQPANPVDVWSTVELRGFETATARTAQAVLADEGVDGVVFVPLAFDTYTAEEIGAFASIAEQSSKPIVLWPIGSKRVVDSWEARLASAGVPVCPSLHLAVKVLAGLWTRSRALARTSEILQSALPEPAPVAWGIESDPGTSVIGEKRAKEIISKSGIETVAEIAASTEQEAVEAGSALGFPVVLKLEAENLAHRTELGGVVTDVRSIEEVKAAYRRLMQIADARKLVGPQVLVQEMIRGGVEVIVGGRREPGLGTFVLLGMGGVDVESLGDVSIRPTPITEPDALGMIEDLRGGGALKSARDGSQADIDALVAAVTAMSTLIAGAPPAVSEIEVNPLIVLARGHGAVAVDGLIFVRQSTAE
ncbi:MAG: acetate--CoA ligase family protein [Acidimicrobiia bacterium]